jgi:hypothetical protein
LLGSGSCRTVHDSRPLLSEEEPLKWFQGLSPESQNRILVLIVFYVPRSLKSSPCLAVQDSRPLPSEEEQQVPRQAGK